MFKNMSFMWRIVLTMLIELFFSLSKVITSFLCIESLSNVFFLAISQLSFLFYGHYYLQSAFTTFFFTLFALSFHLSILVFQLVRLCLVCLHDNLCLSGFRRNFRDGRLNVFHLKVVLLWLSLFWTR